MEMCCVCSVAYHIIHVAQQSQSRHAIMKGFPLLRGVWASHCTGYMLPTVSCSSFLVASHVVVVQGVLKIRAPDCGVDPTQDLIKLWMHEHSLIYSCRCSRPEDASFVRELLHRLAQRKLGLQDTLDGNERAPLVFSEFVTQATSGVGTVSSSRKGPRPYELVTGVHLPFCNGALRDCSWLHLRTRSLHLHLYL